MALIGNCFEDRFYNFFMPRIKNLYGVSALAGNWRKECGFKANNLQNSFQKKLGHTDESYTKAVDDGSYKNFVRDGAGYGCAQWTYWSRKQGLLDYAKEKGVSIGDEEMQFEYAWKELSQGYKSVLSALKTAKSVKEASYIVLTQYERPANQGEKEQAERTLYGEEFYKKYTSGKEPGKGSGTMSNSSLVDCTVLSPNHSGARTKKICKITPHIVVGQLKAEAIGGCFHQGRGASCNYGIGTEGRVCLIVPEEYRSWCSSSNANDQEAVTIECASDKTAPYALNSTVYNKLVDLCVDICKRNGKNRLIWISDKQKALAYVPKDNEMQITVHRWFANKSCPGDWLYSRLGELANTVTARLGGESKPADNVMYRVQVGAYSVKSNAEAQLKKVAAKFNCFMVQEGNMYKIQVGAFSVKANADAMLSKVKAAGFDAFITTKGGQAVSTTTPAKKSVDEVAKEVLQGKWGNGADRKRRLTQAGYNYTEVQNAVNKLV